MKNQKSRDLVLMSFLLKWHSQNNIEITSESCIKFIEYIESDFGGSQLEEELFTIEKNNMLK